MAIMRIAGDYGDEFSSTANFMDSFDDVIVGAAQGKGAKRSDWVYHATEFGASETKSVSADSVSNYTGTHYGGYLMAEKKFGDLYIGAFYGYTQYELIFDGFVTNEEKQKLIPLVVQWATVTEIGLWLILCFILWASMIQFVTMQRHLIILGM